MIDISITEAHNKLSALLKKVQKSPVMLTRRGKPVGVLLSPEEYERLRQFEAYNQVVRLSQSLHENIGAAELYRSSHDELETR